MWSINNSHQHLAIDKVIANLDILSPLIKGNVSIIKIDAYLSQYIGIGIGVLMPKFCRKDCNNTILRVVLGIIALYLAFFTRTT